MNMHDPYLHMPPVLEGIRAWLREDIGIGDITTLSTIPAEAQGTGVIHVKDTGIVAGLPVAEAVFAEVDPQLQIIRKVEEGAYVTQGTILLTVSGSVRSILLGERLALNLLQRMSGIATRTKKYVDALEGLSTRLVDTRKTTPGHRLLEKYAVRVGGGYNHRFGLYDAVMIKDNHIKGSGGVKQAIEAARSAIPHTMKIEVEVESFPQMEEALEAGADIIMLDNMKPAVMAEAVQRIRSHSPHVIIEGSGSVSLETIKGLAQTGVDVISVGRLTYSFPSLDISLDLGGRKETVV
jgi:nicotinate-nucleotide pyrophosphorylase (carboxylating)